VTAAGAFKLKKGGVLALAHYFPGVCSNLTQHRFSTLRANTQQGASSVHRSGTSSMPDPPVMQVSSFGVGGHVKLPGPSKDEPNVYNFGTPYEEIFNALKSQNEALYTRNGLLTMLQRNIAVKRAPEKWQHNRSAAAA
jgi:hypothetical protein